MNVILDIAHCPVNVISLCKGSLKLVKSIKKVSVADAATVTYR
jgi:hypothetical protein